MHASLRALIGGTALLLLPHVAQAAEDDPLAELDKLAVSVVANSTQAGGSIRAKLRVDSGQAERTKDPRNLEAIVVEVVQGSRAPLAVIRVKVMRAAQEGPGQAQMRNASLVLRPALLFLGDQPNFAHEATQRNAAAYYLRAGDRVAVRLGAQHDTVWEAAYLERM